MKQLFVIASLALALAAWPSAALAADVQCPLHPWASCYDTGRIAPASGAHLWHCSCGDDVWASGD